ncbi:MAG: polyphosphate kinase 1 [Firmicutes bacterium]|uniref:Polyphosphate kinase n=1 Tax=Candidatus Scybalomonas excrementavium TaxID=2840943 RepID=A0A9D9HZJ0_9FIRM|nr:polyphosphate kinase 1 [Candidatus Scybalomonas excrementavium]
MDIKTKFEKPENFWNRESSWLKFNARVLSEAMDQTVPLFERMKFLSITASNLDEFFMVRMASLYDKIHSNSEEREIAGMTPLQQLETLMPQIRQFMQAQYKTYKDSLLPDLQKVGLYVIESYEQLTKEQKQYVNAIFKTEIYPVLTPMAVDFVRPFPVIKNQALNLGILYIGDEGKEVEFATVQVPKHLPRVIEIPSIAQKKQEKTLILIEQIIRGNLQQLFLNREIVCVSLYRMIRSANFNLEEGENFVDDLEEQLQQRQVGKIVKLEVENGIDARLLNRLKKNLQVSTEQIYKIYGAFDLKFLMELYHIDGFHAFKYKEHIPEPFRFLKKEDIFTQIKKNDRLLHLPYDSFDTMVQFMEQAANDKSVIAIKQTLYRVSENSPIVTALLKAAKNGKQVTVLVEVKARFDEINNIMLVKTLEKAGCHVIYGVRGLKTHSKITLVVRKEEDGIKRYVHLGTGNYNDLTAKTYTDMGILTANTAIGEDATAVFNMLFGGAKPTKWNYFFVAPICLRERFLELIKRETQHAQNGRKAHIIAKMNSLCDKQIIQALYEASYAGVKIELIIRGICCLKTQVQGISENITVRSIVGTFLEHSRLFYFYNDKQEEVYMGSADWMPRNLDNRIEIVFPILDESVKKEVINSMKMQLKDNVKAHILKKDGSYQKVERVDGDTFQSQEYFIKQAYRRKESSEKIR